MSGISRAGQIGAILAAVLKAGEGVNLPIGAQFSAPGAFNGGRRSRAGVGPVGAPGTKLAKRFAKGAQPPRGY